MRKTEDYTPELITTLAELKEYASTEPYRFKIIKANNRVIEMWNEYGDNYIILRDNSEQNEYYYKRANSRKLDIICFDFVEEFEEWSISEDEY